MRSRTSLPSGQYVEWAHDPSPFHLPRVHASALGPALASGRSRVDLRPGVPLLVLLRRSRGLLRRARRVRPVPTRCAEPLHANLAVLLVLPAQLPRAPHRTCRSVPCRARRLSLQRTNLARALAPTRAGLAPLPRTRRRFDSSCFSVHLDHLAPALLGSLHAALTRGVPSHVQCQSNATARPSGVRVADHAVSLTGVFHVP